MTYLVDKAMDNMHTVCGENKLLKYLPKKHRKEDCG